MKAQVIKEGPNGFYQVAFVIGRVSYGIARYSSKRTAERHAKRINAAIHQPVGLNGRVA